MPQGRCLQTTLRLLLLSDALNCLFQEENWQNVNFHRDVVNVHASAQFRSGTEAKKSRSQSQSSSGERMPFLVLAADSRLPTAPPHRRSFTETGSIQLPTVSPPWRHTERGSSPILRSHGSSTRRDLIGAFSVGGTRQRLDLVRPGSTLQGLISHCVIPAKYEGRRRHSSSARMRSGSPCR